MIGYHYTTLENWRQIQKEGLKPICIRNEEVYRQVPLKRYVEGIWLWEERATRENHLGNILWVLSKKKSWEIVLLKVRIPEKSLLHYGEKSIQLRHRGEIGTWIYHRDCPARIAMKKILPKNIKLVGQYNLVEMLSAVDKKDII